MKSGGFLANNVERVGLRDRVTREQFHAFYDTQNPYIGKRLTLR